MQADNKTFYNSWFEKNPKKTLFIFLILIFTMLIFSTEKYLAYRNKTIDKPDVRLRYVSLRERQPFTNVKYLPDINYLKTTDNLVGKHFWLRVDENGFIKLSKIHENPDITIVFLGGSTTECLYVDETDRFPYLVGRIVEKRLNKKVNSYNSGVSGNNSMHSINILLNKIIPMKPDTVVMEHNINDLIMLCYTKSYWRRHPTRSLIIDRDYSLPQSIKNMIKYRIIPNLYNEIANTKILNYIKHAAGVRDEFDEWAKFRTKNIKIDRERAINDFRSSLQTFISICKIWNIKPVLMTQPTRLKEEPDDEILAESLRLKDSLGLDYKQFKEIFDLFNETIRKVAKDNNILLIDLAKNIPPEREYMYDIAHFNQNGSLLAANIISEELLKILERK